MHVTSLFFVQLNSVHPCELVVNPLQPSVAFLYPPQNIRKPLGFLMFSGVIEKQHRAVMG